MKQSEAAPLVPPIFIVYQRIPCIDGNFFSSLLGTRMTGTGYCRDFPRFAFRVTLPTV